jgi:hypothetical protein
MDPRSSIFEGAGPGGRHHPAGRRGGAPALASRFALRVPRTEISSRGRAPLQPLSAWRNRMKVRMPWNGAGKRRVGLDTRVVCTQTHFPPPEVTRHPPLASRAAFRVPRDEMPGQRAGPSGVAYSVPVARSRKIRSQARPRIFITSRTHSSLASFARMGRGGVISPSPSLLPIDDHTCYTACDKRVRART